MKVSERLDLIDRIGREIQSRYSFSEVDGYLGAFGVSPPDPAPTNSKWLYVKAALRAVDLDTVLKIAADLDLVAAPQTLEVRPPANWVGTGQFRLFISHISKDKRIATRLKECLWDYGISGFVAH